MTLCALLPAVASGAPTRAERREMQRDEALLREWLAALPRDSGVGISHDDAHVTLRFPAAMVFEPDSSSPKADAMNSAPLAATLKLMKQRRRLSAQIIVYTDSIGGVSANQIFSEARASALSAMLSGAGIAAPRLHALGAGPDGALATNATPEGRSENRRIEVEFQRSTG